MYLHVGRSNDITERNTIKSNILLQTKIFIYKNALKISDLFSATEHNAFSTTFLM